MKYLITFFLIIIIFPIVANSQTKCKITLKSGRSFKGFVVDTTINDSIIFRTDRGSILTYHKKYVLSIDSLLARSFGSLGVGFGIPYGTFGLNLDLQLLHYFNLSAGVGWTILDGIGWNVGIKYFILPSDYTIRPRILFGYGLYGVIATTQSDDMYGSSTGIISSETFNGFNIGAGARFMFGEERRHGFDFDIIYILDNALNDRIDERKKNGEEIEDLNLMGNFKISLGYRYGF